MLVVQSAVDAETARSDLGRSRHLGLAGDVATITLPGNHFGILLEPSGAEIGERLAAAAVAWES